MGHRDDNLPATSTRGVEKKGNAFEVEELQEVDIDYFKVTEGVREGCRFDNMSH